MPQSEFSPVHLIQEDFFGDPWRVAVSSVMLNVTNHRQVRPVLEAFLKLWPTYESVNTTDLDEIHVMQQVLTPLGLYRGRTSVIIGIAIQMKQGNRPLTGYVFGLGKYVNDALAIFVRGDLTIEPTDKKLKKYLEWARERTK